MVPRTPLSKVPRVLTKRQILGNSPKPSKSESLEMGPLGNWESAFLTRFPLPIPRQLQCSLKNQCNCNFCFILFFIVFDTHCKKIILQKVCFLQIKGMKAFDFTVAVKQYVEKDLVITFRLYGSVTVG